MHLPPRRIRFYLGFINKLIRAGRDDGTKHYFTFDGEIDRGRFITFANRFIEDYYATVAPEFALTHPMKFCFAVIAKDGAVTMYSSIRPREIHDHPEINGGLLYIKTDKESEEHALLDASIFRQACLIQRERMKFLMTVLGSLVAVVALAFSLMRK